MAGGVKPDVIVAWPQSCDYPIFRQFIRDERQRFGRVIVAFTYHPGVEDYRNFAADALGPSVICFDSPGTTLRPDRTPDWRDAAVNVALQFSTSDWVWFTEQDFFIHDPVRFWGLVDRIAATGRPIGWREDGGSGRVHPSCLFVRAWHIEQTDRYFGQDPIDHFYTFGEQLPEPLFDLRVEGGLLEPDDFEHLMGTTQNHRLTEGGEDAGVFHRERFRRYLVDSLATDVPRHPRWDEFARKEIERG